MVGASLRVHLMPVISMLRPKYYQWCIALVACTCETVHMSDRLTWPREKISSSGRPKWERNTRMSTYTDTGGLSPSEKHWQHVSWLNQLPGPLSSSGASWISPVGSGRYHACHPLPRSNSLSSMQDQDPFLSQTPKRISSSGHPFVDVWCLLPPYYHCSSSYGLWMPQAWLDRAINGLRSQGRYP